MVELSCVQGPYLPGGRCFWLGAGGSGIISFLQFEIFIPRLPIGRVLMLLSYPSLTAIVSVEE